MADDAPGAPVSADGGLVDPPFWRWFRHPWVKSKTAVVAVAAAIASGWGIYSSARDFLGGEDLPWDKWHASVFG